MHEHRAVSVPLISYEPCGNAKKENAKCLQKAFWGLLQHIRDRRNLIFRNSPNEAGRRDEEVVTPCIVRTWYEQLVKARRQDIDQINEEWSLWRRGVLQVGVM